MTDEIYRRRQLHEEASRRACEAAQELARVAKYGMITAPAAFAILGNLKLLAHLTEVTGTSPTACGLPSTTRTSQSPIEISQQETSRTRASR